MRELLEKTYCCPVNYIFFSFIHVFSQITQLSMNDILYIEEKPETDPTSIFSNVLFCQSVFISQHVSPCTQCIVAMAGIIADPPHIFPS